MNSDSVPAIVIGRLPLYLRMLAFLEMEGKTITSSQELAERLGFSSAQIRKDLSYFGEFGKQGTGYNIAYLQEKLRQIMKIDRIWDMILIGVGHLGHALANYGEFESHGFRLVAIFDNAERKIGARAGDLTVQNVAEVPRFVREHNVDIAMLAVPAQVAQGIADRLVELGIHAILSYAPITLNVPPDVRVAYIDPVAALQSMTYYSGTW